MCGMVKIHSMRTPAPSEPRLQGRTPKRVRTQAELAELAQRLGADWHPGDNVMTWIRRHEATTQELTLLVRDGWSWTDVGRALDLVGIRYQTGTAIPGDLLRRKAGKARADERKRQADHAMRRLPMAVAVSELPDAQPSAPVLPVTTRERWHEPPAVPPPPSSSAELEPAERGEPAPEFQFQPARLKGWSGTRIVKGEEPPPAA